MYMYIHIYIYIYVYVYTHTYNIIYICICIYASIATVTQALRTMSWIPQKHKVLFNNGGIGLCWAMVKNP